MVFKIVTQNLSFSYKNETKIFEDLNLSLNSGEIIFLVGKNGIGKSTFLKIVSGLITNFSGKVYVDSENKNAIDFTYLPENPLLFQNLTGQENINFFECFSQDKSAQENQNKQEKIKNLIKFFCMENALNQTVSSYSKGMKQKLSIVCSLVQNSEVLALDEPLSGLDFESRAHFRKFLTSWVNDYKVLCLVSSHLYDDIFGISSKQLVFVEGQDPKLIPTQVESKKYKIEYIFNGHLDSVITELESMGNKLSELQRNEKQIVNIERDTSL